MVFCFVVFEMIVIRFVWCSDGGMSCGRRIWFCSDMVFGKNWKIRLCRVNIIGSEGFVFSGRIWSGF